MVKRIHRNTTPIPRGYIFSAVQFSRGIHVVSIIVSTWIRLSFMIGCPLKNPRGFYVAYLRDSDVDFTGCFCRGCGISWFNFCWKSIVEVFFWLWRIKYFFFQIYLINFFLSLFFTIFNYLELRRQNHPS